MSSLAAAKADNYYYPKNWDPSQGSLNKFQKSHPLGVRAKKINQGILVIRFEMPFHVRCMKCSHMIAKGVRFNAEKRQIGNYMSSKIWEFSMKCPSCKNKIVVVADPEKSDYVLEEGVKKWLNAGEKAQTDVTIIDEQELFKNKSDPFFKLEKQKNDKVRAEEEKPRLCEIMDIQDKWKNDYDLNSQLRKKFRAEKKEIQKEIQEQERPKNFALRLKTELPSDLEKAKQMKFLGLDSFQKNRKERRDKIKTESIFKNHQNEYQDIQIKLAKLPNSTKQALKNQLKIMTKNKSIFARVGN